MYYIDQGIIDVATCVATAAPSIGWMTLIQEYFDITSDIFICGQSKIFQNISFTLLDLPLK